VYTTSQIVERIKLQAPDWSSVGTQGLVSIVNEVNRVMMGSDIDHMVVIDSATGLPPFLSTTDGTLHYDCPSNCRKVASVFISSNDNHNTYDKYGPYQRITYQDKMFYEVPITSRRISLSSAATVTFRDNPGATTSKYYLKYYREPTSISSINIQIDVPPDAHPLFIDGVLARIAPIQYGKVNPWLDWLDRMKMEFWQEMNDNAYKNVLSTVRPC